VRLVGVVMQDAEIDGLVTNLVVNGVEVMSYVEAELDRRHPVRRLIRSTEPADLREAWQRLRDDWATTAERVRSMPAGSEHRGVDHTGVAARAITVVWVDRDRLPAPPPCRT
jgi:hypothetical protein